MKSPNFLQVSMTMTPADRMRRYRERKRQGVRVVRLAIECDFDLVDWLIEQGWLDAWDDRNDVAVSAALARAFAAFRASNVTP